MNDEKREILRFILTPICIVFIWVFVWFIVIGPLLLGLALYSISGVEWVLYVGFAWWCIVFVWAISTLGDE